METGKMYTHQTLNIQTGETITEIVKCIKIYTDRIFDDSPAMTLADVALSNGSIVSVPDNHWTEYEAIEL